MPSGSARWRAALVAAVVAAAPACGGGHHSTSLATRQADFRNVENIIVSTSKDCRTAVGRLADAIRSAGPGSPTGPVTDAAGGVGIACTKSTDEEIEDLETLTVPSDLSSLRLGSVATHLTAWCADAVSAAHDAGRLVADRNDKGASTDLDAKRADMAVQAQSARAVLAAAAAALKLQPVIIDLPPIGAMPPS